MDVHQLTIHLKRYRASRRFANAIGVLLSLATIVDATRRWAIAAAFLLSFHFDAAVGAAPAQPPSSDAMIAALQWQDDALLRVGERLVVAGRPFCSEPGWSAGMTVQRLGQYGADYRDAAVRRLGLSALPTVTGIAEGGAAAAAGLRPGDALVAIDGARFAVVPAARTKGDFAPTSAALDQLETALADGEATMDVIRAGRPLTMRLVPRAACRARFDVRAGRSNNASSDGTYVQVSSNLVDQARDDAELATILAHELAHNILRHPQRLRAKGPRPRVRDTEIEADRLSVYLLDAAGYPVDAARAFWGRWGRANDHGIFADGTHPSWRKRVRAIETEAAAIAAQRKVGRPIRVPPELVAR